MPGEAIIELDCDAAFAWQLLSDPRLVPEWISGVADAEVITIADGRPAEVRFAGMPSTASVGYRLAYTYDDAARRLDWRTVGGDERRVDGSAWLEELPTGCRFHYALTTWNAESLPYWAHDSLAGDTPERVVASFARFIARRWAARTR